jgi:hypothetical protein
MSLTDEARAHVAGGGPSCATGDWFSQHPGVEDEVREAINHSIPFSAIHRALEARLYDPAPPSLDTMRRHIRGECRTCQRTKP